MPAVLTPIFLAIVGTWEIGLTGISIASVLANTAAGLLMVGAMALLAPKPKKPEDGKVPVQQATPPRIFAYGKCRVAGYVALLEEDAGNLYYASALTAHKCNRVTGYWLNDDKVVLVAGAVQGLEDGRYANGRIKIDTRLGEPAETPYGMLEPLYPSGVWSELNVGNGVTSMAMMCKGTSSEKYGTRYPYGRPAPSVELETAVLYDPRTDVWEYSDNTALEIIHFLCFSEFGPQRDYDTCILPVVDIWKNAANICDETVALRAGGTEKRYRSGGFDTTEHDTRTVLNELLISCDGWLCELGDGSVILTVGKFEAPDHTITDDDIVGWTIQSDVPDEYAVNEIAASFCFVDAGYSTTSVDPWEDIEDQALRGSKRSARLELPWVQSFSQARRLGKREMSRQKERVRGQLILNIGALHKIHKRWVSVKSSSVPFLGNRVIENRKAIVSIQTGSIILDYVGSGPYVDDWTPETDEGMAPIVPVTGSTKLIPVPSNVVVTVEEADGEAYIDVSFDDSGSQPIGSPLYYPSHGLTYIVRWRYETTGNWVEVKYANPPDPSGGRITLTLSPVPQNTSLDVSMCAVGPKGHRTAFSTETTVSTIVDKAAPSSPVNGSAVGSVGRTTVSWYNPNSRTFDHAKVFRGGSTDPFSLAAPVSGDILGSPNQLISYVNTPVLPGMYAYWIVAYSKTGSASTPSGPFVATVT